MNLFKFDFNSMTVACNVILYAKDKQVAAVCYQKIKNNTLRLEKKYNFYNRQSYLSREINRRKKNTVTLDTETAEVLKKIRVLSEVVDVFDVTVGTLKSCYKLDTADKLQACMVQKNPFTGLNAWLLKGKKLHIRDKQTLFDLGGVIKEYAVDEAANIAKQHNVEAALISFGGDVFSYGNKSNGKPFAIGVQHPKNEGEYVTTLPLDNQAMATSSNQLRNSEIEGKMFPHIIGKKPNSTKIISATVISDSTLTSGVYSTAFMLEKNIDILDGLGIILVDEQLNVHQNIL